MGRMLLLSLTLHAAVEECTEKGCLALSLLELLGFNLTFVFLASLLVLIQVRLKTVLHFVHSSFSLTWVLGRKLPSCPQPKATN